MQTRWEAVWKDGIRITWRSLTWREYQDIHARPFLCPMDQCLEVYRLCILEGPPIEKASYGTVAWLAGKELEQNPFSGRFDLIAQTVTEKRAKVASNYLFACSGLIASVLHVPFDTISTWDANEFFNHLAQAEFIAGKPLDPTDPTGKVPEHRVKGGKRLARPVPPTKQSPPEVQNYTWSK